MNYIKKFSHITIADIPSVGGKNASLGEMIGQLTAQGITVPDGFAITAAAYWHFLESNELVKPLKAALARIINADDFATLQEVGAAARKMIKDGTLPADLQAEIAQAHQELEQEYKTKNLSVAVRSSATAEDLPNASFAGQQETFLNIKGVENLERAVIECMASLFTDRAIVYRMQKGFDHFKVGLSVGVQKMIRSDLGSSGVAFSLDTETGFSDAIVINASWGLGESIVLGSVTPDEFVVHKPTLEKRFAPIIKKIMGTKLVKTIYVNQNTCPEFSRMGKSIDEVSTSDLEQHSFSLSDQDVLALAKQVLIIEKHYNKPMDVEWAKDGTDGKIYIIQARPETVHARQNNHVLKTYRLKSSSRQTPLATGQSIGQQIATGVARIIKSASDIMQVQKGDIIVTEMTDPDWVPAMKRAAGIITNRGGRTCHAAIVSRELNIPALVGTGNATEQIANGQEITIDCSAGSAGFAYLGKLEFQVQEVALNTIPKTPVPLMVNLADPASAFTTSFLPVTGIGLARVEFIIANQIKIHPMALLYLEDPSKLAESADPDKRSRTDDLEDWQQISNTIEVMTRGYLTGAEFFADRLAQGIGMLAAAFYPRPAIVRLSDFKSNEYRNLIGGQFFEDVEENPMLGFRGASRYYHERYREAFALECAAFAKVRNVMGLTNVKIMVPFVRTVAEAHKVLEVMGEQGLKQGENGLEIIMMCEIPSNVILIEEFSKIFDGFSIGSNDLTQLTLGVDRDSEILAGVFDERDEAVKRMMAMAIAGAHVAKRPIGICGQAPSDYPEIAQFLVDQKIDYLSLNPDSVLPFLMRYKS